MDTDETAPHCKDFPWIQRRSTSPVESKILIKGGRSAIDMLRYLNCWRLPPRWATGRDNLKIRPMIIHLQFGLKIQEIRNNRRNDHQEQQPQPETRTALSLGIHFRFRMRRSRMLTSYTRSGKGRRFTGAPLGCLRRFGIESPGGKRSAVLSPPFLMNLPVPLCLQSTLIQ